MIEFVALSDQGRRITRERRVRLSDAGVDGLLRPDGLARYLQDIAVDDWDSTGVGAEDTWVVRRTSLRVVDGGHWPLLGDEVSLTTWCGGSGAAWAERRTNISIDARLMIEVVALWVPVDPSGRPRRLRQSFFDVYGEAAAGRKVVGRVPTAALDLLATQRPWPIRRADLDVVGHVNNAAVWSALTELALGTLQRASLTHLGPLESTNTVTLASDANRLWLVVDGVVRVAGDFTLA